MKRKGKQMVTAVLSTAMLFTMSSMPVYAEENVEAQIKEIYDVEDVGTSADSPKFAIGKIQLAGGQVGQAYSEMLSVEEGAASSWEIVDGSLPAGLALNEETGEISGTPEEEGSFVLTVKAVSGENETVFDETEFSIEITEGKEDFSQSADGLIQDTTNLAEAITTFDLDDTKSMEVVQVDVSNVTSDEKCTVYDDRIVFLDDTVIYELTGTTDKYLAFWIPNEPKQYHLRLNNVTVNGGLTNGSEGGSTYVDVEVPEGTVNDLSEIKANDLTIHGSGTINTTLLTINQKSAGGKLSSSLHITDTTIVVNTKEKRSNCWEGTVVLDGNADVTMTGNDIYPVLNVGQGPNETASVTLRDNASLKCLQMDMVTPYEYIVDGIQLNNSSLSLEDNGYLEAEGKNSTNEYGSGSAIISNVDVTVADQAEMKLRAYGVALSTWESVILNGGTTKVESYGGNAIYAGKDLEVDGGTLNATTTAWYPAIYTDGEILIQNHAEVTAEGGNDTIRGVSGVTISDSTVSSTSTESDTAIAGGNFENLTGDVIIERSIIKANAVGAYSIRGAGDLTIKDSWVESFGGEVDHMDIWTTWENMVSFQDDEGTVIGNPSLPNDVEMTTDMRLSIPANTSLTVPASKTLTNSGAIENIGGIKNDGTISNGGTITNKVTNMNLPDSLTLKTGNTQSFTDYVTYGTITGNAVTGTAPVNNCTWSSDKPEIASVENGVVTAKAAGTAVITASADNMQDTCTITVQKKSSGGSSSSGSSSGGGTTTETTNPDGSTTTTETKPDGTKVETTVKDDGTKVETTTRPDGSKTEVTTEPDGTKTTVDTAKDETVTTTVEKPDGSKTETKEEPNGTVTTTETDKDGNQKETVEKSDGTTTITYDNVDGTYSVTVADADGNTKSEVTLTEEAILKAAEEKESISLPMPELPLTNDKEKAPVVTVSLPENTEVAVEIPVEDVTAGTVAVLVDENGTETIIKTTVSTENGILVKLADGDTIKVVENSKEFDDVPESYWGYEAVQFASSHELFAGTGDTVFSPDAPMTRAMVWTVLARLDGINTTGEIWYAAGQQWAMEHGISDGTNPNAEVTREQMAAMLYRYALLKEYDTAEKADLAGYADAASISDYAVEAMAWANAKKVINGVTTTTLEPQMDAARAQVAQMLKSFCENVVK